MSLEYIDVFNQKPTEVDLVEVLIRSTPEKPFLVALPDDGIMRLRIMAEQIPQLIQEASKRGAKNIFIEYRNN